MNCQETTGFNRLAWIINIVLVITSVGCQPTPESNVLPNGEAKVITVQHCLIAFQHSLGDQFVARSQDEAKALAEKLLERARAGEDFAEIVKKYTNDAAPGIYRLANRGVEQRGAYARGDMVPAFGDVGFALDVGEFGLAAYDPATSQFGWHIIKRIE
jgi:hypothetical protein